MDIDIVTTVAHSVHNMPQICLKMQIPLINCIVNNALESATVPRHTRTSVHWRHTTVSDNIAAG